MRREYKFQLLSKVQVKKKIIFLGKKKDYKFHFSPKLSSYIIKAYTSRKEEFLGLHDLGQY